MANGDPQKPNYNRLLFDTVSGSRLKGGAASNIRGQQELASGLDLGIMHWQEANARRGQLQPKWDQFKNMLVQTAAEVGGGTLEGIGYIGNIGDIGDIISGTEAEFGNALSEFGKSIKEGAREAFPIYTSYGEGFKPWNWSWWMTHAPSIASTLSLMIPSGMVTGVVNTLAKSTNAFKAAMKAAKIAGDAGDYSKALRLGRIETVGKGVTQAVFSRHMENMMESSQTFDELYEKNLRNGLTEEDARSNAALGASSVYNRNWAMLAQDIPQYIMLGTGLKGMGALKTATKEAKDVLKIAGKTVIPATAKPALNLLKTAVSEGFEEGYQFVIQEEADYLAQRALDPNIESPFSDRLKEYLKDGELWTSVFFGAIGGGVMQSVRGINEKLTKGRILRDDLKSWGAISSQFSKTMEVASELEDTNLMRNGLLNGITAMLDKAYNHDTVADLNKFLDTVMNEDVTDEQLAKAGVDRDSANIMRENAEQIKQDIARYGEIYTNNIKNLEAGKYASPKHAAFATRTEFLIEKLNTELNESKARLEQLEGNIANFSELSPQGQNIIKLEAQQDAIKKAINFQKKRLEKTESQDQKDRIQAKIILLEADLKNNEKDIILEKDLRSKEDAAKDNKVDLESPAYAEYKKEEEHKLATLKNLITEQGVLAKVKKGEMPYGDYKGPDVDDLDEDDLADIPKLGDFAYYTNPRTGQIQQVTVRKIENVSEYTVQEHDDDGNLMGPQFKVSVEHLERRSDSAMPDPVNVEPVDPETFPEQKDKYKQKGYKGVAHPWRSISWWDAENPEASEKFNKFISNPNLTKEQLDNAVLTFIPEPTKDRKSVDNVPIRIKLEVAGETFEDHLFVVEVSSYKSKQDKEKIRATRQAIMDIYNDGKIATAKGIDLSRGHANNVEGLNESITSAWNIESSELDIGIIDEGRVLNFGGGEIVRRISGQKGIVMARTTKTINGQVAAVRVNPKRISKEHALILWDALQKLYKEGSVSTYKEGDPVQGLTAIEVVKLLVYEGDVQTNVKSPKRAKPIYLANKQMWVATNEEGELTLYYGSKVDNEGNPTGEPFHMPFLDSQLASEMKEEFVKWATENKNYPTYIAHDKLDGLNGINAPWNRKFKIGSMEFDGTNGARYADLLINHMLTTDIEEYVPGSIMEGPVIEFKHETIAAKDTKPVKKSTRQSKDVKRQVPKPEKKEEKKGGFEDVAADYLLNGGVGVVLSVDYLIQGIAGIFKNAAYGINFVRNKYGQELKNKGLDNIQDALGTSLYDKIVTNLKEAIENAYPGKEASEIFDIIMEYPTGLPVKLGRELEVRLDKLHKQPSEPTEEVTDEIYEEFVNIGSVPIEVLQSIANKIKAGTALSKREQAIHADKTGEIEKLLQEKPKTPPTPKSDRGLLPSQKNKRNRKPRALREYDQRKEYIKQNAKKELKAVRQMLGRKVKRNFKEVDQVIKIASEGKEAWATYSHDLIKLWKAAETGTAYHESFHRVTLGYLTPEEREGVWEEARRQYNLRGISDIEVDDFLAEKFRAYVMKRDSERQARGLGAKVGMYFKRLFNHIWGFFTGPTRLTSYETDRLFSAIYEGKYRSRRNRVGEQSYEIDGDVLRRRVYGHEFEGLDTGEQIKQTVRLLTYELLSVTDYSDLNEGVTVLNWNDLLQNILSTVQEIEELINEGVDIEFNKTRLQYWLDVLGYDEVTKQYGGFNAMKELIMSFMSSMNINVRPIDDPDNLTDDTESGIGLGTFDKQSFEVSVKENALGTIKLNVALLEDERADRINPMTGGPMFVDYNDTWNSLLGDLYEFNDIEDMMNKIKELEDLRPGYAELYDKLLDNKENMFQTQFLATMRNHKHAYQEAVTSRKKGYTHELNSADVKRLSRDKVNEWNVLFNMSGNTDKGTVADGVRTTLKTNYDALFDMVRKNHEKPDFLDNLDGYYDAVIRLLNSVNIGIDKQTIDKMLEKRNTATNIAFFDFVSKDIGPIVEQVIGNFVPAPGNPISKIYNQGAVNALGDAYAEAHPEEVSVMVLGPGSAQYYTYANHSTVTSLIRDIKLDPTVAEKLVNRRFNVRSKFLNQLAFNEKIRKAIEVFTFAGITRTDTGDEGRDYFGMTPEEDYSLKLHSILNGLVAFPTMSDKKTYYWLKGLEVIDVPINTDGTIADSVIDVIYDHVLDEYDRITAARAERDSKSFNQYVENYHAVNGDVTKGQAYDFVLFSDIKYDEFNEVDVRQALKDMFNSHIEAEIEKGIKEGIIGRNNETGKLYSRGLDEKLLAKYKGIVGQNNEDAAIRAIFDTFVVRNIDNNIELHKMFIGDPAFYKDSLDIGKRLGALIAHGEEMALNVDHWGDDLTKAKFNVSTLKTQKLKSAYYDNLKEAFMRIKKLTEEQATRILKPYTELEQADGQAFITPAMYRSISIRIGEWSRAKDDAYNILTGAGIDKNVSDVFDNNKQLDSIGSVSDYAAYLKTIFPNSKVNSIVYHGTNAKFDTFNKEFWGKETPSHLQAPGFWFTHYKETAENWGNPKSVLINVTNPFIKQVETTKFSQIFADQVKDTKYALEQGFDSAILDIDEGIERTEGVTEYVVFETEQIHILGSKNDISGFEAYMKNRSSSIEQEALIILQPLKTVYFGYDEHAGTNMALPVYDKMSMAPLFRKMYAGTDMEKVLDLMERKGIDMLKMDSATKVGNRGQTELWADKDQTEMNSLEDIPIYQQQFKNLRRQVVTPLHDNERRPAGTQFIKIAQGDLNMTGEVYTLEGKKVTGRTIANTINRGLGQLSSFGKEEVHQEYGYKDGKVNTTKLVKKMRKEAREANMPVSTIEAIREENGRLHLELDSMPNRKWFWSRFISSISKKVVNRKLPGGQYIQVSNLGFRKSDTDVVFNGDNRIEWLKSKEDLAFIHVEDDTVVPMECAVSVRAFKHAIPNYNKMTWKEKVAYIKKHNLDVIGYRIPTQGQNSTVVMRVAAILPEEAGDSIILPSEFTGLTGSDFDIDKLFLVRKNYNHKEGKMVEIDFITDNNEKAYNRMLMYKFDLYKHDLSEEFKEWYRDNNYDRIERIDDEIDRDIEETKERLKDASAKDKPRLKEHLEYMYDQRDQLREERDLYTFNLKGLSPTEKTKLRNRITEELIYNGYFTTLVEFSKLSDMEKNIPKAIENRVINAYISILTSEEHLLKIAAPLGSLNDTLKKKAEKVRAKYDEGEKMMLSYLTPRMQSDLKFKYSIGKNGIGPFALHNAHHIITQLVQYKMLGGLSSPLQHYTKAPYKGTTESLKGTELTVLDLSQSQGKDGIDILDWLSALIDAHVDMAKDPYIMDLNVTPFTYDILSYLLRTGVGETAFDLIANPAVKEASDLFINTRRSVFRTTPMSWNNVVKNVRMRYAERLEYDVFSKDKKVKANAIGAFEKALSQRSPKVLDGKSNVETKWFKDSTSKDHLWTQVDILTTMLTIKEDAQVLTNDVQSTQIDTKKYGSSIIGLEAFFNRIRKSTEQSDEGLTWGYKSIVPYDQEELIDSKERPNEVYIADYYRNALVEMVNMSKDISLDTTPLYRAAVDAILTLTSNKASTDESVINRASNELYSALFGHFFFADQLGLKASHVQGLFQGQYNLFGKYNELKEKHTQLFETNPFLKRLRTWVDENYLVDAQFVLRDQEHKDPFELEDIIYNWQQLLAHDDIDVQNFAKNLFLYSFYTSGFNRRLNSFNNMIPPSFMKELKFGENIYSFDNITKALFSILENDANYPALAKVVDDILSHYQMAPTLDEAQKNVPAMARAGFVATKTADDNKFYTIEARELIVGTDKSTKDIVAIPYIIDDGRIFKYRGFTKAGDKRGRLVYTEIDKRGFREGGRFVHEYGLDRPVFPQQAKQIQSEIPSDMNEIIHKEFNEEWYPVDSVASMFNVEPEVVEEKAPVVEQTTNTDRSLSTKESPLEIFVDGSSNDRGYGAWMTYNGEPYGISGATREVDQLKGKFPNAEMSNPTMELLGLSATLRKFAETGEHIVIRQDYIGAINFGKLWDRSEGSKHRAEKPWVPKEEYIKYIVNRIEGYMDQIEANGGSVSVQWIPGHITPAKRSENPEVFTDDGTYERLRTGNNNADSAARATKSKDTVGDLLELRTSSEEIYKYARTAANSYEVSSRGDKRFSAMYAKLASGKTIEDTYQDLKGTGKGKPASDPNFDYWGVYLGLWRQWANENPTLIKELGELAKGKVLTDMFANTDNNQARALATILNERLITEEQLPGNPEEYTNHSGGALGADTMWDAIGRLFGVVNHKHYWHGKQTPGGNAKLTDAQLEEGWQHVLKANETLNRKPEEYKSLLSRNWFQVKNADAVFAIGEGATTKQFAMGEPSIDKSTGHYHLVLNGGTAWAVQMAVDNGKPTYVFLQDSGKWYKVQRRFVKSVNKYMNEWTEISTPTLTKNFAGIGTRKISQEGNNAIGKVYAKTFNRESELEEIMNNCKGI